MNKFIAIYVLVGLLLYVITYVNNPGVRRQNHVNQVFMLLMSAVIWPYPFITGVFRGLRSQKY
jgi:ABC-type Na+ efflux pump permease subunit